MSYYTINGKRVFMTHHRTERAREAALAEKDIRWTVKVAFDSPERREAAELVAKHLHKLANDDPVEFDRDWVQINLEHEEASENIWDLLYDYCELSNAATLVDIRDDQQRTMDDFMNNNYTHPMGKVFGVQALGPKRWFKRQSGVLIRVDADKVSSVCGTLEDFIVICEGMRFQCSRNLTVG